MVSSNSFGALMARSSSLLPSLRLRSTRNTAVVTKTEDEVMGSVTSSASDAFDAISISPPTSKRPSATNPRRHRVMAQAPSLPSSASSSTRTSAVEPVFEAFGGATPEGVMGNRELAAVARSERWHLAWPHEGHAAAAVPDGAKLVLMVHKSQEAGTAKLLHSVRQAGDFGLPIFVLLFDVGGAASEDFEVATALQQDLLREGADDVLCNARTSQELRLAVAMAMCRRTMKLDEAAQLRASFAQEAERVKAERLRELEEVQATGLFWQLVDRLFKDFPTMDPQLPEELQPGTKIGPCSLDSCLGQGSYGKVFGAVNERTGSREAVKVIAKSSIKRCKTASALYREVHMHSRLQHDNIARQFGVMHGPMHVFIRLEEASTTNLFKLLKTRTGALPLEDTKRYQGQLADAVAYCHAQGVAHRDLKPENIALDSTGLEIKVLDFGCAMDVHSMRTEVVGSFPFMAPEILVACSSSPYEPSGADVWSCAVILIEMLFGVHYFNGMLGWERSTRVSPKRHAELAQYFGDDAAIGRVLRQRFGDANVACLEELMRGMFEVSPARRWSSRQVAESKWYGAF